MSTISRTLLALGAVTAVGVGGYLFLNTGGNGADSPFVGFKLDDVTSVDDSTAELEAIDQSVEDVASRIEGDATAQVMPVAGEELEGPSATLTL
ncbi:MAG: hypothetical protein KDC95_20240, partial [Planctomycetes bacterium]|nr:hypothetical protein [Planctomycetota bacterium]